MNIDSSYVSPYNVNEINQTSLEKIGTALKINKASEDTSDLVIASQLGLTRDSLSQAVENMSSGIAMSNIAQSGLSDQKEILESIRTETLKAMNATTNQDGKDIIAQTINKSIEQFDAITQSTTYNGTSLLKTDGDTSDDISIVDNQSTIELEKSDTSSISTTLKSLMNNFSTDISAQTNLLNVIDQSIDQLNTFESNFSGASNVMESSVKNSISTEKELANAESTIMDIDYSKESSSFSKTNLLSQIGLMMQSQANAIQGKNISLLSY